MTAEEIRFIRSSLGLSQEDFAAVIGCSKTSLVQWELGRSQPGSAYKKILILLKGVKSKQKRLITKGHKCNYDTPRNKVVSIMTFDNTDLSLITFKDGSCILTSDTPVIIDETTV